MVYQARETVRRAFLLIVPVLLGECVHFCQFLEILMSRKTAVIQLDNLE